MTPARRPPAGSAGDAPIAAWSVHLFTASGAVLALLAVRAVADADVRTALLLLFGAVVIDATDGVLARIARVRSRLPWFDGAKLDDIVDYLTFVFVPAYIVIEAPLVTGAAGIGLAVAMLVSSAYGFNRQDAKSEDRFFTGFPSYWNIVVFYLYAGGAGPLVSGLVIGALSVMVFVPIGYVYPSRTPVWRAATVGLGGVWGGLLLLTLLRLPERSPGLLLASLGFPVYYTVLSFALHRRRRPAVP